MHFLGMCFWCLIGFAFTAHIVFGPYRDQFHSLDKSMLTVYEATLLGGLDPEAMVEHPGVDGKIGSVFLILFYGSFVVLSSFLLLQFLTAIVCDVMTDVRNQEGSTIRQNTQMLYRHFVGLELRSWPRPALLRHLHQLMKIWCNEHVEAAQHLLRKDEERKKITGLGLLGTWNLLEGRSEEQGRSALTKIFILVAVRNERRYARAQTKASADLLLQFSELLHRFVQGEEHLSNCKLEELKCYKKLQEQHRRKGSLMPALKIKLRRMMLEQQAFNITLEVQQQQTQDLLDSWNASASTVI